MGADGVVAERSTGRRARAGAWWRGVTGRSGAAGQRPTAGPLAAAAVGAVCGAAAGAVLLLAPPASSAARSPEANYLIHCAGCHRIDGRGFEAEVPDLTAELDAMLRVPGGREYLVQVPGASQAPISDAELAAVVNLVIERFAPQAFADGIAPLDAAEVARHRARRPLNIFDERQRLLALIAARP